MALTVVVGPLVLLFFAAVDCNPTDEYAPFSDLDYCGQRCPSSCEEAEEENAVCRCDSECERYGDCCSPQSGGLNCHGGEQRTQPLAGLQCRSIHLDSRTQPRRQEAFWMVSACPEDWQSNEDDEALRIVDEKCKNGSNTLPPVTDLDSGVVYKNEYCAVCHQVTNIQPWGYRFGCSLCLKSSLATYGVSLLREIIEHECIACGFHVPQTGPPPRHCLHDSLVINECLAREVLEERTGLSWEGETYNDIVTQCQTGPIRPVAVKSICASSPTYRNQYCAICNAERSPNLVCADPYSSREETDFCQKKASQKVLCAYLGHISSNGRSGEELTVEPHSEPDTSGSGNLPESPRLRKAATDAPEPQSSGSGVTSTTDRDPDPGSYYDSIYMCSPTITGELPSFTLFFDVTGDSAVVTSSVIHSNITTHCSKGQVFDPINQFCRQTICPKGFATLRKPCAVVQNIPLAGTYNSSDDSLVMCDEGLIVLRESEFELLDNDTILFHNEMFEIVGYNDSSPIICSNFTQNGSVSHNVTLSYYTYPPVLSVLTYVGCSLSVVGCVVVLLTYSLFKELRTLPGRILMNLASTILATCLFLLAGIPIAALAEEDEFCETTSIFLHWLMLSQFSWMSIMSFEQARSFYRASHLYLVEDKSTKNKIFLLYLLIGWGIPSLITVISLLLNFTTDTIQYGRDGFCWIGHVPSFYIVFVAPVALSIVFNGITFVITFSLLFKVSKAQAKLKKKQSTLYLRVSLCVFSITGLTWVFGFLAILIRDDWAWYSFIILTSTQGLVICTAFVFTKKICGLYKNVLTSLFHQVTPSKRSCKQCTQENSLKHATNSRANPLRTKLPTAQDDVKVPETTMQNTRRKESRDQVSIEMDIT